MTDRPLEMDKRRCRPCGREIRTLPGLLKLHAVSDHRQLQIRRPRLRIFVGARDRRDFDGPFVRAGWWWFHRETPRVSVDAMIKYGAVWLEVWRYV